MKRTKRQQGANLRERAQAALSRSQWLAVLGMAVVVSALVAAVSLSPNAAGGEEVHLRATGSSTETPEPSKGTQLAAGAEIRQLRTATSDTFRLPDGAREARIYEAPVNYKDEEGDWKPIVEALEPRPVGGLTNGANSFDLILPERLGAESLRIGSNGEWVSDRLLGEGSESAEVERNTASYEATSPGTTFELASNATGVKETIELENPSQPTSFHYELDAAQGLTPSLEDDGSVAFRRNDGTEVARLPAPTITDNATGAVPNLQAVHYGLTSLPNGNWKLELAIDKGWLEAPGRVWPLTIDPSIIVIGGEATCANDMIFYRTDSPVSEGNWCAGYFDRDWVYYHAFEPSGLARARSRLKFNLSGIPAHAFVTNAVLAMDSVTPEVAAVELRSLMSEDIGGPSSWSTPVGEYSNSVTSLSAPSTEGGWWFFEKGLSAVVNKWLAGELPNYGLLLKTDETPCSSCSRSVIWADSAYSEPSKRPYLSVTYYPQAPLSSKLVSPTEGTRTARRLKLKSTWTSAGVEGVTYQYREGKTGPFQTIPAELVSTAAGKAVSWPLPVAFGKHESEPVYVDAAHVTPALREKGGVIQVRAIFEGPAEVAGYCAPIEAVVNRKTGGPKDATAEVGPGTVDLLTGNFATAHTDVSIPTFNSSLAFERNYSSRGWGQTEAEEAAEVTSPLGPGWKPGISMEEAGGSTWQNLKKVTQAGSYEEYIGEEESAVREYSFSYAVLYTLEGGELAFEETSPGVYVAPPEVSGWSLTTEKAGEVFVLSDPSGGRTTFSNLGVPGEWVPTEIFQPGGSGLTTTKVSYELKAGRKRLHFLVAAPPPGVSCNSQAEAMANEGCRALVFNYVPATTWGAPAADGERLASITYYAPGLGGSWEVAKYAYNTAGRLTQEWDPRISPNLIETYTYEASGALKTITPAGQEPWTLEYGTVDSELGVGRLVAVKRPSLLASPSTAQTTIAYEVPLSGSGAPYEMGPSSVAQWGQTDIPVDATAVFPPDQVPSSPPSSYSHALIHYLDEEGRQVNVASPSGAGTANPSIATTEADEYGNTVRELTAQNRLRVMAEPEASRPARSTQLDTQRVYGASGNQLEEEQGPLHMVHLESGTNVLGRYHKVVQYDKGMPVGTTPDPHLPTRETSGVSYEGSLRDERVNEIAYDWTLRKPEKTTVVMAPGEPSIESVTVYNDQTGLPVEARQPTNKSGGGAGTTKTTYYVGGASGTCVSYKYAGLPCESGPAAQPGTPGQPEVAIKQFTGYNALSEHTETIEKTPTGTLASARITTIVYDAAGRQITKAITGGGTAFPKTETVYSSTMGMPFKQRFVCEGTCAERPTTATYNKLGQVVEYVDADGNVTKTTYDVDGRIVTRSDGHGTQTVSYDPTSGLATKLEDSGVGTFTASYDADGNIVERTLPDGLTAKTTFNEVDEPVRLTYTKASSCDESCTWLEETLERDVYGDVTGDVTGNAGTVVSDKFQYDRAGRLVQAQETPKGGSCTTRQYKYDEDSNRKARITIAPGVGGICATTGGSEQKYEYDASDRLIGTGLSYDNFGRVTGLPAADAGGSSLTTTYYSNNMIASQVQGGITNTYELDPGGRQRTRLQGGGGLEGTEVFHYDGPNDAVSWTSRGTTWTRNVTGIAGELVAVQQSEASASRIEITNLHGDVVATAELSATATKLKSTSSFEEFGGPAAGGGSRFGWLGGKQRRTELPSGVIQMGLRSYIPALGRFLSPDPVMGGSANPYDYANGNPITGLDLSGESPGGSDCTPGFAGCQCKLWSHLKKGQRRGTMVVTVVRKCNRFGGVTKTGYAQQWSARAPSESGFHNISLMPPVYPTLTAACIGNSNPCQNYQKTEQTVYCTPGTEYQLNISWGVTYNYQGGGPVEHQLNVQVQQRCPY